MKTLVPQSPTYKWVRSSNGLLAGVCEGMGKSFGIEPWIVRALWLASILFLGFGLLLYVICAFSFPREDRLYKAEHNSVLGVCVRISRATNMEIGLVRFLAILLGLMSAGATVVGYIVLHFVLPQDPAKRESLF